MQLTTVFVRPGVVMFAFAAVVGCGGSGGESTASNEDRIRAVVPQYVDAINGGDVDAALGLTCSDNGAQDSTKKTVSRGEGETIEFVGVPSVEVNGDTAAVEIEFAEDGNDAQTQTSTMVLEDGKWLMCDGAD
jgi:ketosteroid isomerase-like protein